MAIGSWLLMCCVCLAPCTTAGKQDADVRATRRRTMGRERGDTASSEGREKNEPVSGSPRQRDRDTEKQRTDSVSADRLHRRGRTGTAAGMMMMKQGVDEEPNRRNDGRRVECAIRHRVTVECSLCNTIPLFQLPRIHSYRLSNTHSAFLR